MINLVLCFGGGGVWLIFYFFHVGFVFLDQVTVIKNLAKEEGKDPNSFLKQQPFAKPGESFVNEVCEVRLNCSFIHRVAAIVRVVRYSPCTQIGRRGGVGWGGVTGLTLGMATGLS